MFNDVNEVRLLGRVIADPKYSNGRLGISLVTNRSYKKGEEWVEEPTFHNLVVWGAMAESLSSRVMKGTKMYASGRFETRKTEDGKTFTSVVVSNVTLLDKYKEKTDDFLI